MGDLLGKRGGGVRDRIGNIPPLAFAESLCIVLKYVQSRGRLFEEPVSTLSIKKKSKQPPREESPHPSQERVLPAAKEASKVDGEPWVSEEHTKCYAEIKKKENEIACLHVQIAQYLERYRAAEARRVDAEERYKELWKSYEAATVRKEEVQGHWGGTDITPTNSRPITPRDLSVKLSPVNPESA